MKAKAMNIAGLCMVMYAILKQPIRGKDDANQAFYSKDLLCIAIHAGESYLQNQSHSQSHMLSW